MGKILFYSSERSRSGVLQGVTAKKGHTRLFEAEVDVVVAVVVFLDQAVDLMSNHCNLSL